MIIIHWHELKDYAVNTVAICSTLHAVLPPWDWQPQFVTEGLSDFPRAQNFMLGIFRNRWYKLIIYTIGYIALNMRSTVWKSSIGMSAQFQKLQPGKL